MVRMTRLRVGQVVRIKEEIKDNIHRQINGAYMYWSFRQLAGRYFRIKEIRNFTKKPVYRLGRIADGNHPTIIYLPREFLEPISNPCLTLKKKGIKIEDEVEGE